MNPFPRKHPFPAILALLLFFGASSLIARDLLLLRNGDRLTGTITGETSQSVEFRSEILGTLAIAREKIEKIEKSSAPDSTTNDATANTSAPAAPPSANSSPNPAEAPSESPQDKQEDTETAGNPSFWDRLFSPLQRLNLLKKWKSRIDIGLTWQQGESNKRDYRLGFRTERKLRDLMEFLITLNQEYSETEQNERTRVNRDRFRGRFRYRYNLVSNLFLQSNTSYLRDQVSQIDHDAQQSFGVGWRVLDSNRLKLSVTPSLSAQYLVFTNDDDQWIPLATLFQDSRYRLTERFQIFQESRLSIDPTTGNDLRYEFMTRFETRLTESITANLRYEFEYDSSVLNDIEKQQQLATVTFGYTF